MNIPWGKVGLWLAKTLGPILTQKALEKLTKKEEPVPERQNVVRYGKRDR